MEGLVYNATAAISNHPGGVLSILNKAGMDCTEDFYFHTPQTQKLWKTNYVIGTLIPCQYRVEQGLIDPAPLRKLLPIKKKLGATTYCVIS